ncbi:hypothetical protein BGZ80_010402 [Entomortierella chlamydospora]|uniref:G domain-containing protein n=1 Tax=Entomortierella chlamydospora TaxID=101097 RepID=A0A9P6N2T1_9FUNG|nr:hypothetical protein BGZ80_010402 [Entomortierella chlamydospora]
MGLISTDRSIKAIYSLQYRDQLKSNYGAGKSTLLSQLGGDFPSGVALRRGYTTALKEYLVTLESGEQVLLMDVPGMYEASNERTKQNASQLTEALSKGYNYKLYFVLKADNRGPPDPELVMMAKVNECVKQINGAKVTFRIIVNQINDAATYNMYRDELAYDNFKSFFEALDGLEDFSFDINIDHVELIRFDEKIQVKDPNEVTEDVFVAKAAITRVIAAEVRQQSKVLLAVDEIRIDIQDLKVYQKALYALASPMIIAGGLVVAVVGGTGWVMYKAGRLAHKGIKKAFSSDE